jgi:CRISPR/Cas system endoribonuclease Cas6 (RAMP superfamily)
VRGPKIEKLQNVDKPSTAFLKRFKPSEFFSRARISSLIVSKGDRNFYFSLSSLRPVFVRFIALRFRSRESVAA